MFAVTVEGFSCSVMSNSLQPMDCSPPGSSVHGILLLTLIAVAVEREHIWKTPSRELGINQMFHEY